jgi:hypothetical protein
MMKQKVIVIGGGLAGMVVAKELCKRGIPVVILEATAGIGGKAGGEIQGANVLIEHGYHVFPAWYRNTRQLFRELNIEGNFVDSHMLINLKKNKFPKFDKIHEISSIGNVIKTVFSGSVPWSGFYFLLDLCSQPTERQTFSGQRHRGFLDRVSVHGFLQSRWYAMKKLASFHAQMILQAQSIPYYEISAMTVQKLMHHWLRERRPLLSFLNGNLQDKFISPLEKRLRDLGVDVQYKKTVTKLEISNGRVAGVQFAELLFRTELEFSDQLDLQQFPPGLRQEFVKNNILLSGDVTVRTEPKDNTWVITDHGEKRTFTIERIDYSLNVYAEEKRFESTSADDIFVLATPAEVTFQLYDDDVATAEWAPSARDKEHSLSDLVHLRSMPMAGLTLYLNRRIPDLPPDGVSLVGSIYSTSFVDISQQWDKLKTEHEHTVLSMIAADFAPLKGLSPTVMAEHLIAELLEYVPTIQRRDIAQWYLAPNLNSPLFLNTVGVWHYRPGTRTRIGNLYIAGDYCRTTADLTTMESAVLSGLSTAQAVLTDQGMKADVEILPLRTYPTLLYVVAKYIPLIILLALLLVLFPWARRWLSI